MSFNSFVEFVDTNYSCMWTKRVDGTNIDRVLILHVTKGNVHPNMQAAGTYSKGGGAKKTAFDLTSPIKLPAASSPTWNAGLISNSRGRSTQLREPIKEPINAWDSSTNSYKRTKIQISFPPGQPSSSTRRSLIGNSPGSKNWSDYVWSQVEDDGFIIFMKSGNNMTLSFGTPYHSELHELIEEFGVSKKSPGCYFERPPPKITSTSGHIYVLKHPYDDKWLKIGKAGSFKLVRSRLSAYNTGSPIKYSMLYVKPTSHQDDAETAVHDALEDAGVSRNGNTEWFQTDLVTAQRCIDFQVNTYWPSDDPPFSLGTGDTSKTNRKITWVVLFGLGSLLFLLYNLIKIS